MPFVGTGHIWMLAILGVIAIIVFGPKKLPELGSGLGRAITEFRRATSGVTAAATQPAESTPAPPRDASD